MATAYWIGSADADVNNNTNWEDGSGTSGRPGSGDDVVITPQASYGMTSNLNGITAVDINSIHFLPGFTKDIGLTTGAVADAYLELNLDNTVGTKPNRFVYEADSTLAKIHLVDCEQYTSVQVLNPGDGSAGQPALQLMSTAAATHTAGYTTILGGEVGLGWNNQVYETDLLTVGSKSGGNPIVWIEPTCESTASAAIPVVTVNSGIVYLDAPSVTVNQYGGTIYWRNGGITTVNAYGGEFVCDNPSSASAADILATLNLRGGHIRNDVNPTAKTVTNANFTSGRVDDPAGLMTWTHPIAYQQAYDAVQASFGPARSVTIA